MKFYILIEPDAPWGDYSTTLQHGGAKRVSGTLEVTRAGPHVPPISFPYEALIVTESFKALLVKSGLKGLKFNPAVKKHIVKIPWETWGAEPKYYPKSNEPGDYLRRKHDPASAAKMEELFELALRPGAELKLNSAKHRSNTPFHKMYDLDISTYTGLDIFRPIRKEFWPIWIVSEQARKWFQVHAPSLQYAELKTIGKSGENSNRPNK